MPDVLTAAEAVGALTHPFGQENLAFDESPILAIDLGADSMVTRELCVALTLAAQSAPAVLVGLVTPDSGPAACQAALACDIILGTGPSHRNLPTASEASLGRLHSRAVAHPEASRVLVEVIRGSLQTSFERALWTESIAYSTLLGGADFRSWLGGHRSHADVGADRRNVPPAHLVLTERSGPILSVTFNDPGRHNAFGAAMRDQFVEALRVAAIDTSIREIVVQGAGASFCSGGDLDEFGSTPDVSAAHRIRTSRNAAWWVYRCRPRIRFIVHGHTIGAGLELAALAPVEAAEGTTFLLPEVGFGLIPGAGGTASLPRRIGRHRTAWLALAGEPLDQTTATDWGLLGGGIGR